MAPRSSHGDWLRFLFAAWLCLAELSSLHAGVYSISYSGGLPGAGIIPDGSEIGWADTRQVVVGSGLVIEEVELTLDLRGGWNGDLYGWLRHETPVGTGFSVVLNRVGSPANGNAGYADSGFGAGPSGAGFSLADSATHDVHTYRSHDPQFNSLGQITGNWGASQIFPEVAPNPNPNLNLNPKPSTFVQASVGSGPGQRQSRLGLGLRVGVGKREREKTEMRPGNWKPDGSSFASFGGLDPNGSWTVFFADLAGGDAMTVHSWGLQIRAVPEPALTGIALALAYGIACVGKRRRSGDGSSPPFCLRNHALSPCCGDEAVATPMRPSGDDSAEVR